MVFATDQKVKRFSPHHPHGGAWEIAFSDWLHGMAAGDVPYQARALAIYVGTFATSSKGELARLSGMDTHGKADKTFNKWRQYLIEQGWVFVRDDGLAEPAVCGIPVRFEDVQRQEIIRVDSEKDDGSREWLRQATILAFGFQCSHCDGLGDEEIGPDQRPWCLDRIIPGKVGGQYVAGNVTLSCWACNSKRGASPIERRVFSLADWRALRREWVDVGAAIIDTEMTRV